MAFKVFPPLLACALLLWGCPQKSGFKERSFFLMGTLVNITLPAASEKEFKNVSGLMEKLSADVTGDSVSISSSAGPVKVSPFTCGLIKDEASYYMLSRGRFNAGIFTVASLYGFPEGPYSTPDAEALAAAMEAAKGSFNLTEDESGCYASAGGMKVDFGAFAKGAIVDEAASYLKSRGVEDFIVNGGGDLYASGSKNGTKWRLGITDPWERSGFIEAVELEDKALATSGTYERYFTAGDGRRISHLFDGVTGKPAGRYASLSVIAGKAREADALSTVYFFMDENEIAAACGKLGTPVMLITEAGERKTFCGWPPESRGR